MPPKYTIRLCIEGKRSIHLWTLEQVRDYVYNQMDYGFMASADRADIAWSLILPLLSPSKAIELEDIVGEALEAYDLRAEEDNDYCPICNVLTNTKNCATSKSCCVCQEITFCDDCVKKCEGEDCSHEWETHHVCVKCEEVEKKINLTQGA